MRVDSTFRVMWLLNHSSARRFEVSVMRRLGITEIFTPKSYPQEVSFRSASVTYAEDEGLTIPADDLAILNSTDWYNRPSHQAWEIANKYFDAAFFIFYSPEFLANICDKFKGAIIWRVYGRTKDLTYSQVLEIYTHGKHRKAIATAGRRFWFGEAYEHLHKIEDEYLQKRSVFLPLGLANSTISDKWAGDIKKIYFVCPDISVHSSYRSYYEDFIDKFAGLPYAIGGTQGLPVDDPNILGYVPEEQHLANMSGFRVMFYHSTEPNHIHYHPFEAIRAGMPLVFMAGGMLDSMGGKNLPGRAVSFADARKKLERILKGDKDLIARIRGTQNVLLRDMQLDRLQPAWLTGIARIREELDSCREEAAIRPPQRKKKRIALILPEKCTNALLDHAICTAQTLHLGGQQFGETLDFVILYCDEKEALSIEPPAGTPDNIKFRPFRWKYIPADETLRAMRYAGFAEWKPEHNHYAVIDDGIAQLTDCNLWLLLSDGINFPILPMRPMTLLAERIATSDPAVPSRLAAIRALDHIITTTDSAYQSATQYVGINPKKVLKSPLLIPRKTLDVDAERVSNKKYFTWITDKITKQHSWIVEALKYYYTELDGKLDCRIVIRDSAVTPSKNYSTLEKILAKEKMSKLLNRKIFIAHLAAEHEVERTISGAEHLLIPEPYPGDIHDLLSWSQAGCRCLTYKDALFLELNSRFSFPITWQEDQHPLSLANNLKEISVPADIDTDTASTLNACFPSDDDQIASTYWTVVRECL